MKILICGDANRAAELKGLLTGDHEISESAELSPELIDSKGDYDLFFDLNADDHPEQLSLLLGLEHKLVFLSSAKKSLAEMAFENSGTEVKSYVYGINALPGFIERAMLEISMLNDSNQAYTQLEETMSTLGLDFQKVADRTGLVTPRVISMIINEACFTLQEGTASKDDIDLSLKKGTNYPHGPLEWADKIGVENVYQLLNAVYNDTGDERYKICPLLKQYYLKGQPFFE